CASSPACRCRFATETWGRASLRRLPAEVSLNWYSVATRSTPRREASGLTHDSRAHPRSARSSADARTGRSRHRTGTSLLQTLAELGLAPGAVHHLALELAAGGVDVVAAGAAHRRDPAGLVEQLLEPADRRIVRALVAGARERVERDQVDLGRVLHLQPVVEVAHQPDQFARVLGLVVD